MSGPALAFGVVAEVEFGVVYDGPVLAEGRMPVRDLAPALLALGDLFVHASRTAYPDREPVGLNIKATKDGSFVAQLVVHSPDAWDQFVHLFSSSAATALSNVKELVIGGAFGLFWLIKRLRGRRIREQQQVEPGRIRLILDDGTTVEVPSEVLTLYENLEVRKKAREVIEPVTREGVEVVKFVSANETTVEITTADVPAYDVPEPEAVPIGEQEVEMVIAITSVTFVEENKWRFSDGERSFAATIDDKDFLRRVNDGEPFRKGDMLRCHLRIAQFQRAGSLQTEYRVVRVDEHIPRERQLSLGDDPSGGEGQGSRPAEGAGELGEDGEVGVEPDAIKPPDSEGK